MLSFNPSLILEGKIQHLVSLSLMTTPLCSVIKPLLQPLIFALNKANAVITLSEIPD